jgi:hypothetical protein
MRNRWVGDDEVKNAFHRVRAPHIYLSRKTNFRPLIRLCLAPMHHRARTSIVDLQARVPRCKTQALQSTHHDPKKK